MCNFCDPSTTFRLILRFSAFVIRNLKSNVHTILSWFDSHVILLIFHNMGFSPYVFFWFSQSSQVLFSSFVCLFLSCGLFSLSHSNICPFCSALEWCWASEGEDSCEMWVLFVYRRDVNLSTSALNECVTCCAFKWISSCSVLSFHSTST